MFSGNKKFTFLLLHIYTFLQYIHYTEVTCVCLCVFVTVYLEELSGRTGVGKIKLLILKV